MSKGNFNSKKFAAFLATEALLAVVTIFVTIFQPDKALWIGIAGLFCSTALAIGYIVSQKSLDRFLASVSSVARKAFDTAGENNYFSTEPMPLNGENDGETD